jgi:copper chaperone
VDEKEGSMLHLKVAGMTCDHCVSAITRALKTLPGVESVSVDLAGGDVAITGTPSEGAVRAAIEEEGYQVEAAAGASATDDSGLA